MTKKLFYLFFLFIIISSFTMPAYSPMADPADGNSRLSISTDIGFDGRIKRHAGFPMTVTITNQGSDISGELVITASPGWNATVGAIITAVDLPANSERTIQLSIPGYSDMYSPSGQNVEQIRFYEGGWQSGTAVELDGDTSLSPRMHNDEDRLVGLFVNQPDSYAFLRSVQLQHGNGFTPVSLDPNKIPADAIGLGMLDLIIIDQFSLSGLTSDQQLAIQSWVGYGGKLVVGGDLGLEEKLGDLAPLLPMGKNTTAENAPADFFNKRDEREYPRESVELITGDIAENARVVQTAAGGVPVVVTRSFGQGEVVQLSFSPGARTFADWDGAASYWNDAVQPALQYSNFYYESIYDRLRWEIASATNYFASTFLPFSVLVLVFVGYVIVVFPLIYFVLKRFDKREHSWWILPALSLVICLAIFGVGGKDRIAQSQMNEVVLLTLDGKGYGQGYGSIALLSNRSGNYTIHVGEEKFAPFPMDGGSSMDRTTSNSGIRHQGDQLDVLFKNVDYWSIRNVSGPILPIEVGMLDTTIHLADKKVTGTLTNNTDLDFTELLFLSGRQEVSLGAVAAGETIDLDFELAGNLLTAPSWQGRSFRQTNDVEERRKEELFQSVHNLNMFSRGQAAIVGFTEGELLQASLAGNGNEIINRVGLLIQPVSTSEMGGGPFMVTTDDLTLYVYPSEGKGHVDTYELERGGRNVFASAGTFEFGYTLPEELTGESVTFTELEISLRDIGQIEYEIYNHGTESYEPLEEASSSFSNPKNYIGDFGNIAIRMEKGDRPEMVHVPEIVVKGEIGE
ncbi:MAG: hypothetical protein LRY73_07460 [Bacillus sp. (in: Bacteria)]|nr:hypothetical protein [Bacillus sp. (in: firmicutes)]